MLRPAAGAFVLLMAVSPASAACTPGDIQIKSWSWERDRGWTEVRGELVNTCAEPTGVQLQLTFRDEAGRMMSLDDSWVADRRDIPAGATFPFQIRLRTNATTKDASIRVSATRRWGVATPGTSR